MSLNEIIIIVCFAIAQYGGPLGGLSTGGVDRPGWNGCRLA